MFRYNCFDITKYLFPSLLPDTKSCQRTSRHFAFLFFYMVILYLGRWLGYLLPAHIYLYTVTVDKGVLTLRIPGILICDVRYRIQNIYALDSIWYRSSILFIEFDIVMKFDTLKDIFSFSRFFSLTVKLNSVQNIIFDKPRN